MNLEIDSTDPVKLVNQGALRFRRPSARLPTCPADLTGPQPGRLRTCVNSESANGIERSRLDTHYVSAIGGIIRLIAPAGYGKSSLVGRWVGDDQRRIVWLDLESVDNDPRVLLATLVEGLTGQRGPDLRRMNDALALDVFGRLIRSQESPVVFVLDDLHRLSSLESAEVVGSLAANLPIHSTLVVAGRCQPHDGGFARLRLDPGVVDLGMDELRFNEEELDKCVRLLDVNLDSASRKQIASVVEGWPTGLRLANLTPEPRDGHCDEMFGAEYLTRHVTDYIDREWLGDTAADDEELLLTAASLGHVSGDLCDHVLERDGSGTGLDQLSRRSQFLIPLDERGTWFRVHGVVASMLNARLRDRDRGRFVRLQNRASEYFERSGDIDRAIEHARRAGDETRCEHLIVDHANDYLLSGRLRDVGGWLDMLVPTRVADSPPLQIVAAMRSFHAGEVANARRWIRRSGELPPNGDEPHGDTSRYHAVRAVIDDAPPAELIRTVSEVRGQLPVAWRVWADWGIGANHLRLGALDSARDAFESAAFEAHLAGYQTVEAMLLACAAAAAHFSGDQAAAALLSMEVAARRDDGNADTNAQVSPIAVAISGLVAAQLARRCEAVELVTQSRNQLASSAEAMPTITMLTYYVLADACLRIGESEWAVANLRLGNKHFAANERGASSVAPYIVELRTRVAAANGAMTCSSFQLTTAELRVIPYLSTNLSLADIARELYVSRNTVKSHAGAIYRKLGVPSRRQAVEVARSVGLSDHADVDPTQRRTDHLGDDRARRCEHCDRTDESSSVARSERVS